MQAPPIPLWEQLAASRVRRECAGPNPDQTQAKGHSPAVDEVADHAYATLPLRRDSGALPGCNPVTDMPRGGV